MKKSKIFMMDLWATVPYYTAYLSRALLAQGSPVMIGSISYYLDPACFSSRGLKLEPGLFDVVGRYPLPRAPRRILKLVEAIVNMHALTIRFAVSPPAIVHVQFLPMLRWPMPLDAWFVSFCRWRGAKIVLTVHDLLPHDTAEAHKQTYEHLYRRMDALICHSDHIKARLIQEFGIAPETISVIPHGPFFYDLPEEDSGQIRCDLHIAPQDQIVLWQGILFPYKGLDLLLDAWKLVEARTTGRLVVVGTGSPDLLSQIRGQVATLALERVTLHLHFTSAEMLVAIYRAAAVVVYPYRAITTSGALATGLSLGKAIVASDLPVFRELLTGGVDALLVNPSDPEDLARAITALLTDEDHRKRLAAAVAAKQFGAQSWIAIADQTRNVYAALLSTPKP